MGYKMAETKVNVEKVAPRQPCAHSFNFKVRGVQTFDAMDSVLNFTLVKSW